jgi:hypothetical protein
VIGRIEGDRDMRPPEGVLVSHAGLHYQDFPQEALDRSKSRERGSSAMDTNNHGFLLVLSRKAYFTVGCDRTFFMLPRRVAVIVAMSSSGSCATTSLASTASPSNPAEAVA